MSICEYQVEDLYGEMVSLKKYEGKLLMVVNSATRCGFTPQYDDLEALYEKYVDQGFEILEFPSNQFANQAPESNEEIAAFCDAKFGIRFPHFAKVDVNGETASPLFKYLQESIGFQGFDPEHPLTPMLESQLERKSPNYRNEADIKWNFTKFLVDRSGTVVARFEPTTEFYKIEEVMAQYL